MSKKKFTKTETELIRNLRLLQETQRKILDLEEVEIDLREKLDALFEIAKELDYQGYDE